FAARQQRSTAALAPAASVARRRRSTGEAGDDHRQSGQSKSPPVASQAKAKASAKEIAAVFDWAQRLENVRCPCTLAVVLVQQLSQMSELLWLDANLRRRCRRAVELLQARVPPPRQRPDPAQFAPNIGLAFIQKSDRYNEELAAWLLCLCLRGEHDKAAAYLAEQRARFGSLASLWSGAVVLDEQIPAAILLHRPTLSASLSTLAGAARDGQQLSAGAVALGLRAAGRLNSAEVAELTVRLAADSNWQNQLSDEAQDAELMAGLRLAGLPSLLSTKQQSESVAPEDNSAGDRALQLSPLPAVTPAARRQAAKEAAAVRDHWLRELRRLVPERRRQLKVRDERTARRTIYPLVIALDEEETVQFLLSQAVMLASIQAVQYMPKPHFMRDLTDLFYEKIQRKARAELGRETGDLGWPPLPRHWRIELGKYLTDHLAQLTYRGVPATYGVLDPDSNVQHIRAHPTVAKAFQQAQDATKLMFQPSKLPMLTKPFWPARYMTLNTELLRQYALAQMSEIRLSGPPPTVLEALHTVSSCAWRVDRAMLRLITDRFNSGGAEHLALPARPRSVERLAPPAPGASRADIAALRREKAAERKAERERYSLWCTELYRLSIADWLKDRPFYLPHNMDFRGRAYPMPPHLNHMSCDLSRSLLRFNNAKPLGERGWRWLRIHAINVADLGKKLTNAERLDMADSLLPDIIDSAERPWTGRGWWQNDEAPWQTLATCSEILAAARHPDGPERYVSSFPVHQDGSCNGLQHYAAMGRDVAGALAVNLRAVDRPQDVYQAVVDLVESTRVADAAQGHAVAQSLQGYVVRRTIKQSVMTTVYGVTEYGAIQQILARLKDAEFPSEMRHKAAAYLAKLTLSSIGRIFTSATHIQHWFTDLAKDVAKLRQASIQWRTPLGLPIVQPYPPDPVKQSNAFPPNFVHSLDSCHMMLTALECQKFGVTFAAVHDCFWTHPCDVDAMGRICRQQFVQLHSKPILADLSSHIDRVFSFRQSELASLSGQKLQAAKRFNSRILQIPDKGDFDLSEVLRSEYFFS
uniref:DNA-directed RNA polymerase n=1 Tax=Macrostomum lignano TaxID=282301 RepID=A0A1I8H4E5_9PLAT